MNSIKTYVEGKSLKVFFIISYNGKRFQVYTGITSTVKFSGMIFPKSVPNARAKTAMLARLFASVEEYIYMNGELPAARMKDEIKAIINGRSASVEKNILYYIDEFIQTKAKDSTKEIFLRTRKRIESFDDHADFDNIDRDWLERFQAHELLKGRMSGGIAIDLRNIRTVFNWAIDNELTTNYPFRRYKIKQEKVAINNISVEQLREIRDCEVEEWQHIYRDLFLLTFYLCGINPVDLLTLKPSNVHNGRIRYKRAKTGHLYDIPVPPEAMEIIRRYRGKEWLLCPLDAYSNYRDFCHHWNDALKKIGHKEIVPDKVGRLRKVVWHPIAEGMTVYTARYTFASIGAELEIPRETIALCLGHSWADVTDHYIAYGTKRIDDAVRKIIDYVNSDKT